MTDLAADSERVSGAIGDRIAGAMLVIVAAAAWWHAGTFVAGFLQPVGPGVFPRLVTAPLGVLSLYLFVRPGVNRRWPEYSALLRQFVLIVLLAGYAAFLAVWGFLPTTMVATAAMTRLFGASWKQAVIGGAALTVSLYLLFEVALGVPLPDMPGLGV